MSLAWFGVLIVAVYTMLMAVMVVGAARNKHRITTGPQRCDHAGPRVPVEVRDTLTGEPETVAWLCSTCREEVPAPQVSRQEPAKAVHPQSQPGPTPDDLPDATAPKDEIEAALREARRRVYLVSETFELGRGRDQGTLSITKEQHRAYIAACEEYRQIREVLEEHNRREKIA